MTDSQKSALLVVDVQVDVVAQGYRRDEVVANIRSLVDGARAAGMPVIWVRHNADEELVKGTPGWEIVPELQPAEGEPIVEKRYGDSFAETELADRLAEVGAESILLCGAQTDACIRSTFFGGLHRGYAMVLVSDAHTTEDLRQWGVGYGPETAVEVLNTWAVHSRLPTVAGATVTTAEAFA